MLKRFTSHTVMALAEASLVALLIVGLLAGTAFAGKGGGGGKPGGGTTTGGGSIVMVPLTDAVPNHGDQVTFNVSSTATTQPMVRLECQQSGEVVYTGSAGFYADYPWQWAQTFTLESAVWTAGAADCTATLYHFDGRRYSNLKSTTFHVEP